MYNCPSYCGSSHHRPDEFTFSHNQAKPLPALPSVPGKIYRHLHCSSFYGMARHLVDSEATVSQVKQKTNYISRRERAPTYNTRPL
jgi:hypothetical protein